MESFSRRVEPETESFEIVKIGETAVSLMEESELGPHGRLMRYDELARHDQMQSIAFLFVAMNHRRRIFGDVAAGYPARGTAGPCMSCFGQVRWIVNECVCQLNRF